MAHRWTVIAFMAGLVAGLAIGYLFATSRMQPMVALEPTTPSDSMGGMSAMPVSGPMAPPVKGYTEGQEIHFLHTEASDPQIAEMLTDMMGSPVLVVPSLAQVPNAMLANVYVFTNGIKGDGPFGFQPDVFDAPPGTKGYSPLRRVNLITWTNEQSARELKSAAEVMDAEAKGEVTIEVSGVVVNMPMLSWPGGQR
jgi:hypothetical protein